MSQVCQATYSGVPVWVLNVSNVSVMRRKHDGWVNATHLLKIAGFDKPKRTRILERDVQTGTHEKVQGGYGKYQGTWVPLDRARILAHEFGVLSNVTPLLDYVEDGQTLPTAVQVTTRRAPATEGKDIAAAKRARKSNSVPTPSADFQAPRRGRPPKAQKYSTSVNPGVSTMGMGYPNGTHGQPQTDYVGLGPIQGHHANSGIGSYGHTVGNGGSSSQMTKIDSLSSSPLSSTSGFLSDEDTMGGNFGWDHPNSPSSRYGRAGAGVGIHNGRGDGNQNGDATRSELEGNGAAGMRTSEGYGNQYSRILLEFFMAPDQSKIPDFLLRSDAKFNVNEPIDDEGHTPLHWAAAMGLVKVSEALLDVGADPAVVNIAGHTPLTRAVHFTNNYDLRSFPQILELLKGTLFYIDGQSATVLHHIAFTASARSKGPSSRYYLELVLAKITELRGLDVALQTISHMDVNQDTALHIAARNGSRKLVKLFLSYNAPADVPNRSGRTAHEYIVEFEMQRRQPQLQSSSPPSSVYMRRQIPTTPIARHQPSPHVSEAAILATQQVAGRMADYLEELAQVYDADLKNRDTDIEQVRQLLVQTKHNTNEYQRQIPELQRALGPEDRINIEIQQASELVQNRSQQLLTVVERTQARDLALAVQKEETDVQDTLKQELESGRFDPHRSKVLAVELSRLQARRRNLVKEIVDLYATAGSGERMDDYRRLVAMACGANVNEIDDLLDGIAQALEDRQ